MPALVDTCIWSLALRRRSKELTPSESALREELPELIEEGRVRLLGPIRQEILSGIREQSPVRAPAGTSASISRRASFCGGLRTGG